MNETNLVTLGNPWKETFTVPREHNLMVLKLQDHSWVTVCRNDEVVFSSESRDCSRSFSISPGTYTIQTDGKVESVASEPSPVFSAEEIEQGMPTLLSLTSDAPDQHIVDQVGEIPADGTSFCTISLEKVPLGAASLPEDQQQDEIFLRTTGGVLMDENGINRIRSVQLQAGQAKFRLVSESTPKFVTVYAFGRNPNLKAEIQIEFV